jgi:hypothetical protein
MARAAIAAQPDPMPTSQEAQTRRNWPFPFEGGLAWSTAATPLPAAAAGVLPGGRHLRDRPPGIDTMPTAQTRYRAAAREIRRHDVDPAHRGSPD